MINLLRTQALSRYFHHSGQFYYILVDPKGICFYINPLFLRHTELNATDIEGIPFQTLVPPGDAEKFQATIKKCLAEPATPFSLDLYHFGVGGASIRVHWEFQALLNEHNKADAIQCIGAAPQHLPAGSVTEKTVSDSERYKAYELSAEGLWRLELEVPVSIDWPVSRIIEHCRQYGFIAECNDTMAKMYGMDKGKDMLGMRMDSMMNLDEPKHIQFLETFIGQGYRIASAETVEKDVNGNRLHFLNNMMGIVEDGMLKRVWGTQQDITEKKKAEEQLLRSELFYRNLIADSLDAILLTDPNGLISFASPSVEKVLGYRPEELLQTNAFVYVHPDDHEAAMESFRNEVNMEPVIRFVDIRLKTKYGEWIYCNVRGHNMLYNPYVGRIAIYFQDISYRKRTENALRESDHRQRLQSILLNNVSDVIVTAALDNTITSWNKRAEETTGIKAEEAIGQNYRDVIPLDYSPYTREQVAETLAKEGVWRGESSFINRDGEKKVHLHTFSLVLDEQQKPTGILVIGKDITELKESEAFYRNLIGYSLDGIVMTDSIGKVRYFSPSAVKLSGYEAEAALGRNIFEFVHPDDFSKAQEAFGLEIAKSSVIDYLLMRLKNANGQWIWCSVRAHNLLDNPGFKSIVIYFTDESKRKAIEDRLSESEQLLRNIIDTQKSGVIMQDIKAATLVCNRTACELLGVSEDQLVGKIPFDPRWKVIRENGTDFPMHEMPTFVAIETKKTTRDVVMGVWRPLTKDIVWLLGTAEPVLDDNNDIIHVICTLTDITEQKHLSQELIAQEIQKQKQLTQATIDGQEKERKEIGKELHDNISQHLTTTRLYLEVAKEKAVENEVREMLHHAHKELTEIINEIRKLSQSLVPPTLGDIGLVESVQDVCDGLQRSHAFIIDFLHDNFSEKELPDNLKLMLFRIIQEQINNIVRHAKAGKVDIELISDDNEIMLRMSDNGIGFDPAYTKKGLGLTNIVNRAGLFDGSVNIESSPGEGCAITIRIPLKRDIKPAV